MAYICRCHGTCGCSPIVTLQPTPKSAQSGLDELILISGIPRKKRFGLAPNNNSSAIWSLLTWNEEKQEDKEKRELQELKDADIQHIRDKVRAQIVAVEQEKQRRKQQTRAQNAKQLAIRKRVGMVPQHTKLDDDDSGDDDDDGEVYIADEKGDDHHTATTTDTKETTTTSQKQHDSSSLEHKYDDPITTALSRSQRIKANTKNTNVADEKFYAQTNAKQDERRLKMAYFRQKFNEERKAQLERDLHSIARRDLPDSTVSFQENKAIFHPYGNANTHPIHGGVMYGNYMASHNTNALSPRKTGPVHQVFQSVQDQVARKQKQRQRALRRHRELEREQLISSQQKQQQQRQQQQTAIAKQQAYIEQIHAKMDKHQHHQNTNTTTTDGHFVQLTPRQQQQNTTRRPSTGNSRDKAILVR